MVSSRRRRCLRQDEFAGSRRRQDRRPHRSGPGADQSAPVRPVRQSAMTRRMLRPARARPRGLIFTHRLGPYPSRAGLSRAMRPDDLRGLPAAHWAEIPTGPKPWRFRQVRQVQVDDSDRRPAGPGPRRHEATGLASPPRPPPSSLGSRGGSVRPGPTGAPVSHDSENVPPGGASHILTHRLGPYPSRAGLSRAMRPDDHGAYPLPTGPKSHRGPSPGDPGRSGRCKSTTRIDGQRAHAEPTAPSSHPVARRPPTAVAGSQP
jgi:hypothetical protein